MNEPLSPWKTRERGALVRRSGRPGPPRPSLPIVPMIVAAAFPASVSSPSLSSSAGASGFSRIWPPADATSALIQTVSDSAFVPCTPRYLSCVLGRVHDLLPGHGRLRRVEARLLGDRLAVPEQLRVGPERDRDELVLPRRPVERTLRRRSWSPCRRRPAGPVRGSPGSASSGMNGGSRLMMSIDESLAARRRASCSRWALASRGRSRRLDRVRAARGIRALAWRSRPDRRCRG